MKLKYLNFLLTTLLASLGYTPQAIAIPTDKAANECVILLHGLARTQNSMNKMADALEESGYLVINEGYPSREHTIQELSLLIADAIKSCTDKHANRIHFVTHSMGGILVRHYLSTNTFDTLGRVVMLSPPNKGSEVVDKLGDAPGFALLNGPAGKQLGTDKESLPNTLGPVTYPVGVITGNKSINLILSILIPGEDDGKVSVERAKVEGMIDFLVVPHTHPMIMRSDNVIKQTLHFIQHGKFLRAEQTSENKKGL